jgi:heme-degrading monooxygenase HmoA
VNEYFTTGRWTVTAENREAFVEAWARFATWASTKPGAGRLMLARDLDEPELFISLGDWGTIDAIGSWKSSPEFRENIAQVLQYVSEFESRNLGLVVTAEGGAPTTPAAAAAV